MVIFGEALSIFREAAGHSTRRRWEFCVVIFLVGKYHPTGSDVWAGFLSAKDGQWMCREQQEGNSCRDTATGNPSIWSSWPSWATCLGRCLKPCLWEVCSGNQRSERTYPTPHGYVHVEEMEALITYPGGHHVYWRMHVTGHYVGTPQSETFSDTSDAESFWRTWLRQPRWGSAQSSGDFLRTKCLARPYCLGMVLARRPGAINCTRWAVTWPSFVTRRVLGPLGTSCTLPHAT